MDNSTGQSEEYRYINCYDSSAADPALSTQVPVANLTLESCGTACATANYTYFGVFDGITPPFSSPYFS